MIKITAISDTHCYHSRLNLSGGDILIHSGDISSQGREPEVKDFIKWFEKQPYTYKIFIVGNHDKSFDPKYYKANYFVEQLLKDYTSNPNHFYLEDTGCEIKGIKFWGSPWTPWFHGEYWAFNKHRGNDIKQIWDLIPMDIDVVITHGPVHMKLDKVRTLGSPNYGEYVGCADLLYRLQEVKPILHISGHIHEGYGYEYADGTHYINASVLTETYALKNKPIDFEINEETKEIIFT